MKKFKQKKMHFQLFLKIWEYILLKSLFLHTKAYHILHELNCKSKLLIYRMECTICRIQYFEKSERQFNIRLNNRRKDLNGQNIP